MIKKRCRWVDVAKGISIILIVLGHIYTDPVLRKPIYAFHVPIFFFLAGVVEKNEKTKFKDKVFKDFKAIMLPYYLVGFLSIILFTVIGEKIFVLLGRDISNYHNLAQSAGFRDSLWGMLYGNSKLGNMQWNLPLWFLPCFFATKLLFFLLEKVIYGNEKRRCASIVLLFFYTVIINSNTMQICLPCQLETAINMLIWYEIGFLIKPRCLDENTIQRIRNRKVLFGSIALLLITISTIGAFSNGSIQVRIDQYSNMILYYLVAGSYIVSVILISIFFEQSGKFQYIGRHSMIILLLHKFPVIFFQLVFKSLLQASNYVIVTVLGIVLAILSAFLCIAADLLLKKSKELIYDNY